MFIVRGKRIILALTKTVRQTLFRIMIGIGTTEVGVTVERDWPHL